MLVTQESCRSNILLDQVFGEEIESLTLQIKILKGFFTWLRYRSFDQGELKTYWQRKLQEGKHKMIILNAIINKLIQRVFAVVKRGTKYEKNYIYGLQGS